MTEQATDKRTFHNRKKKEMERKYTVYMHINSNNGKKYIGITGMKPEHRWNKGKAYCPTSYFGKAINKYGWEIFEHKIMFSELTKEEACRLEQKLIERYKTRDSKYGYNNSIGGELSALGGHWELGEETKKKMRKPKSEEHRKNISNARKGSNNPMYGKRLSEEHKKKISDSMKGKKLTEEQLKKISGANNYKSKRIAQIDKTTGEVIRLWECMTDITRELGLPQQNISACCLHKPKRKTVGGYRWEFAEKEMNVCMA